MVEVEDRLEIDRVKNLITGFGWAIIEEKLQTDKIILTIQKGRSQSSEELESTPG